MEKRDPFKYFKTWVRRQSRLDPIATQIEQLTLPPQKDATAVTYKLNTQSAQATGPENIGSEKPQPGQPALLPVLSLTRITL